MRPNLAQGFVLLLVRGYRLAISPLFPPRCRFLPSCSDYALQAVERHGVVTGGWLALRRFVRCNPFQQGGIDEVPEHPGCRPLSNGPLLRRGLFTCSCSQLRSPGGAARTRSAPPSSANQ